MIIVSDVYKNSYIFKFILDGQLQVIKLGFAVGCVATLETLDEVSTLTRVDVLDHPIDVIDLKWLLDSIKQNSHKFLCIIIKYSKLNLLGHLVGWMIIGSPIGKRRWVLRFGCRVTYWAKDSRITSTAGTRCNLYALYSCQHRTYTLHINIFKKIG